jgi:hypothetical protein
MNSVFVGEDAPNIFLKKVTAALSPGSFEKVECQKCAKKVFMEIFF